MSEKISPLAKVSEKAKIGHGVAIGEFTVIYDNVILGNNVVVESHCVLGYKSPLSHNRPLVISDDSLIRSHCIFYEGSTFGRGLRTGHHAIVRENLSAGIELQIGTLCDFQGDSEIGDFVRTHSSVHIGKKAKIGNCVWIFPYTVLTNDPHPPSDLLTGVVVEDYAVIATMCVILPGVRLGTRSVVGAHSLVNRDVEPDTLVAGIPARKIGMASEVKMRDGSGRAYPWMRHFHRGYPAALLEKWKSEFGDTSQRKSG